MITYTDERKKSNQLGLLENAIDEVRDGFRSNAPTLECFCQVIRNFSVALAKCWPQNRNDTGAFPPYLHNPAMFLLIFVGQIRRRRQ